jgi:hypothetical protein
MLARLLLLICLALTAAAQPLIPDHIPVGGRQPLVVGESIYLLPTRLFLAPSFADSSFILTVERKATVMGAKGGFYHVELTAQEALPAKRAWVYRSELEVRETAAGAAQVTLPAHLEQGLASRALAVGDTLTLVEPLLYVGEDLLGEHEILPGRQLLTVLTAESRQGFLKVRTPERTGWLHRAELPEERRKAR